MQVQDFDAAFHERVGEGVVLLARPADPEHVVEEELVLVARGQTPQLEVRPVQDHPAQTADLRPDVLAAPL